MWQHEVTTFLDYLQSILPLPWFALLGAFIEEVMPLIPGYVMQVGVGGFAYNQNYSWYGVLLLGFMGALGNTIGALLQYGIYRIIGKWVVAKIGSRVGITQEKIQKARDYLQKGARDDVMIFVLRALPFAPPLISPSMVFGILGISAKTFTYATFLGFVVRNCYMLGVGYVGLDAILNGDIKAFGLLSIIISFVVVIVAWQHRLGKRAVVPAQSTDEA